MFRKKPGVKELMFLMPAIALVIIGNASADVLPASETVPTVSKAVGAPSDYTDGRIENGPGLSLAEAADRVSAGMRGSGISGVSTATLNLPPGMASGLTISLSDNPSSLHSQWLAYVTEGAVADWVRSDQIMVSDIIGASRIHDSSGAYADSQIGIGAIAGGQIFESPSDKALQSQLARVAKQFGIRLKEYTLYHPKSTVVDVTFEVPDTANIGWTIDELGVAIEGTPKQIEGSFIRLEDTNGRHLLSAAASFRTGAGGFYFHDSFDEVFGAIHSQMPTK